MGFPGLPLPLSLLPLLRICPREGTGSLYIPLHGRWEGDEGTWEDAQQFDEVISSFESNQFLSYQKDGNVERAFHLYYPYYAFFLANEIARTLGRRGGYETPW